MSRSVRHVLRIAARMLTSTCFDRPRASNKNCTDNKKHSRRHKRILPPWKRGWWTRRPRCKPSKVVKAKNL